MTRTDDALAAAGARRCSRRLRWRSRSPPRPQPNARAAPRPTSRTSPMARSSAGSISPRFARRRGGSSEKNDPKAMTLLGELYADGLGVPNDDKKAAEWYRLAAERGDREAMFALAMFRMTGRGGPRDRHEAARTCSSEAAKLGHVVAAYDLALLYLEGQMFPQDFGRAAELIRSRPPRPATRRRNTRWRRSTRTAAA